MEAEDPSHFEDKTLPTAYRALPANAPRTVGPWKLDGLLGRGGMATVYRATGQDGRLVALKVMDLKRVANHDQARQRFLREADVLARLKHPGIMPLVERGSAEGPGGKPLLYYAMELVNGWTAHELLMRRGRLWLSEAVRVVHDVAGAVAVAHAAGVVHRDLKPSNVFVTRDARVLVADFGIALVEDATTLSRVGEIWGTISFLGPEILAGERADARSDVFALGALLYTLATGELIRDPRNRDAPSLDDARLLLPRIPDMPSRLMSLVGSMLHPDRAQRPANGAVVAEQLAPFAGGVPGFLPPESTSAPQAAPADTTLPPAIPYAAAADTDVQHAPGADAAAAEEQPLDTAPADGGSGGPLFLLQLDGFGKGRIFKLASDRVTVGREPDNDIVVEDLSISSRHARITRSGGRFTLEDLRSSNGTRVNGIGVPAAALRDGDSVVLGLVHFHVVGADRDPEAVRNKLLGPLRRHKLLDRSVLERGGIRGFSRSDLVVVAASAALVGVVAGVLVARLL